MNIVPKHNVRRGEAATLFTIATLLVMAVGTFLGSQKIVQDTVFRLGGFAYDYSKKAHFYTGPTIDDRGSFLLVRGSLCFTGTTIGSQPGRFWVHTPKDPNRGYPQKACDNTNADTKDDCIIYEGKTVEYIAPQVSRPYCDSPDVGKKNWKAWDFTLKLVKPISQEACNGIFVTSSSSFVFRDEIDTGGKPWTQILKEHGVDCGPLQSPSLTPTTPPNLTGNPVPTTPPGACGRECGTGDTCQGSMRCVETFCPPGGPILCRPGKFCVSLTNPPDPSCPGPTLTPVVTPIAGCNQRCGGLSGPVCAGGLRCVTPTPVPGGPIIVDQPGICRPSDRTILCPVLTPGPTFRPIRPITVIPLPITPRPNPVCYKGCSSANDCPSGATCVACVEKPGEHNCPMPNPRCEFLGNPGRTTCENPVTPTPTSNPVITAIITLPRVSITPNPTIIPTSSPLQAKIRGDIVVNSCRRPDNMTTWICPKNDFNPANCVERAAPITFVGQDPTNPNRWLYTYEHTSAPRGPGGIDEPIERGVLYENLQVFAQYNTPGLIRQPGVIGFPPVQVGNVRGHALIPPPENEAIINYEVEQSELVCPPTQPSVAPTAAACKFNATIEVVEKLADGSLRPIPFSQAGDLSLWGTKNDKQTRMPDTLFSSKAVVDPAVGEKTMKFTISADPFTFAPTPGALYRQGERAEVRLFFDTSRWEFSRDASGTVEKLACQGIGCPTAREPVPGHRDDQYGDTTTGFNMDCGTNIVRYGWILKKKPTIAPECVMRDPENLDRCKPRNVEADLISTSTVRLRWDRPEDSCDFRVGVNGDHYRADIIDMSEDPTKIITTCDNLTATRADCTLSSAYNPNSKGTRGNFKKGHNYNVNIFAVKDIQGSGAACLSENGKIGFTRDDDNDPVPTDPPDQPVPPVGGEVLTRQLDWMIGDAGVCWAGWSHGDCRLAYNGTNEWARSYDPRFTCLAPYNQNKVMIGLTKGQPPVTVRTKKVDCSGTVPGACNKAPGTEISQCESHFSNATTYLGGERELKQGECWTLDENLGIFPSSCQNNDPDRSTPQPPPAKPGDPAPTNPPAEPSQVASKKLEVIVNFHTTKKRDMGPGQIKWDLLLNTFEKTRPPQIPKLLSTIVKHNAASALDDKDVSTELTIYNDFDYTLIPYFVDENGDAVGSVTQIHPDSLKKCTKILAGNNHICSFKGTETIGDGKIEFNIYDVDVTHPPSRSTNDVAGGSRSQSTFSLNNTAGQDIDSISIALCNNQNKCTSNDINVSLRSGASTKMKPTFTIPSDTRKISCVVQYADGSRKQCPPQSVTTTTEALQFNINANTDGSVRTALVSPLKSADLNGDCVISGTDSSLLVSSYGVRGVGLKGDVDGDGVVGSKDLSLLLGLLGKNACVN